MNWYVTVVSRLSHISLWRLQPAPARGWVASGSRPCKLGDTLLERERMRVRERENESKRERERERERVRERDGDTLLGGKPRVYISRAIYIYIYSPPCAWRPCVGRFRGATLPGPRLGECF